MSTGGVFVLNLGVVLVGMLALWAVSIRLRDPSFVDGAWGLGFVLIAWVTRLATGGDATRAAVLLALVPLRGGRLGAYLLWRWGRAGPDPRYQAMMRHAAGNVHAFTLRKVFLLQGALMWIVSLPLQIGIAAHAPDAVTPWCVVGIALALIGV